MISRSSPMPLNGQQLMMQLDGLTSAMTGMSVQEVIVVVVVVIDDKPLIIRRQWSPQRRMTLLTAKVVEGETRFTLQAWPHMLYLPHRLVHLFCRLHIFYQYLFFVATGHKVFSLYSSFIGVLSFLLCYTV